MKSKFQHLPFILLAPPYILYADKDCADILFRNICYQNTNRLAFPMEMRGGLAHILEFLFYLYFGECLNHITRLQVVVINK